MFRGYAGVALDLAAPPQGRVLDVAAGAGALSILAAERGLQVTAVDFSPGMVAELRARAPGIDVRLGDGMALDLEPASFDAAFSMFGLMFFPDRHRGFTELHRMLRPGGRAVVSSWVPMDGIPLFASLFGALFELVPMPGPPPVPSLADPASCRRELAAAGFEDVEVHTATFAFEADSFDELWSWLPDSQVFLGVIRAQLGPDAWAEVAAELRRRVEAARGAGPQRVEMPAYLTVGRRSVSS